MWMYYRLGRRSILENKVRGMVTAGKMGTQMKECAPISEHHGTGRGTTSIPYGIQVEGQDNYAGERKEGEWKQEVGRCTFEC